MSGARARRVCVLVLGDFGHSPRMNYHSLSLAKAGFKVDVLAYGGSHPSVEVLANENIELYLMKDPPNFQRYVPRLLAYVFKTLWQTVVLLACLFWLSRPSHLLVQNPPSIPTLPVAWLYCLLRGCALVVDWHNYGYSILALALKETHPLVRVCRFCEKTFGRKAGSAFCVSEAMQEDLRSNWGVRKLDLPMKVVDMFGCGLPVCAVDYPWTIQNCWDLLKGFPEMTERLKSMRENVHRWQTVRWDDNWTRVALPTFASE
ncbi:beta1,4 mannosyltransferase, putative [Ixodes scapularis]|uniref:Beta1,4 mannosyltransferase, putative n=1 Tax=Ixodes scapularis TaxID=6945 RepID=B7PHQ5_IXOSC|nr:beta1,4 mannosyltransferase, putative [Ixodes scapularis]|eukprot:XP_002403375.1 beta1,4 mannosyltransferase, putative [Ixodes scapularis]